MKRWLTLLLALTLLVLSGCAATPEVPKAPEPVVGNPDALIGECYNYTLNENGTYSYTVTARDGTVLLEDYYTKYPANILEIDATHLAVLSQTGEKLSNRWAQFCDVVTPQVYPRIFSAVGVGKTQVAFVENRSGQYHLFVCSAFDVNTIVKAVPLTDLYVLEGEEPNLQINQTAIGITVTYPTKTGTKSVSAELK